MVILKYRAEQIRAAYRQCALGSVVAEYKGWIHINGWRWFRAYDFIAIIPESIKEKANEHRKYQDETTGIL